MSAAASNYRRVLAILIFFTLAAGDFWRYSLSWWGWGAIALALVIAAIVELVRSRVDVRRLPLFLLGFLGFATLSIIWSAYPGATAIGLTATFATTVLAVFIACCFDWNEVLSALGATTRWILGLSLVFELSVSLFVRDRLLPFWVDYSHLEKIPAAFYWSRNLLFEGGRIQGIVGNANLLAMIALLGLILFVVRLFARQGSPIWNTFWVVVAVGTLALTRSSTVIVATVGVVVVAGFVLLVRATHGRTRLVVTVTGVLLGAAAVVVAVIAREPLLGILGKSADLTHRLDIWQAVTELAAQRPVAGWGWVSWWIPWVEPFDGLAVFGGVQYLQAHDAWLDVFLQLGILGLLLMLGLALSSLMRSWLLATDTDPVRAGRRSLDWPTTIVPLLLLVALLVQSLTESRLLIEIGWALLVIVAIKTAWRDAEGVDRRRG
jgi:exopolysaccharide production protein ExoQ